MEIDFYVVGMTVQIVTLSWT